MCFIIDKYDGCTANDFFVKIISKIGLSTANALLQSHKINLKKIRQLHLIDIRLLQI